MGARRYSAATGRFLQVDLYYSALDNLSLSEDPLTQNRCALAGANPINFVEVDGHVAAGVGVAFQDSSPRQHQGPMAGCSYGQCHGIGRGIDFSPLVGIVRTTVERVWRDARSPVTGTLRFTVKYRDLVALAACVAVPVVAPPSAPAVRVACIIYGTASVLAATFLIKRDGGVQLTAASVGKVCSDLELVSPRHAALARACQAAAAVATPHVSAGGSGTERRPTQRGRRPSGGGLFKLM